jgi:hypothetical protein
MAASAIPREETAAMALLILLNDPTAYLERNGLVETRCAPVARLDVRANPVNSLPLAPPLPQPDVVRRAARPADPDAAASQVWPPGDAV